MSNEQTERLDSSISRLALVLALVGAVVATATSGLSQGVHGSMAVAAVLGLYACLAELWPVTMSQKGLRITMTLPFVVGMAEYAGPVAAIATDLVVTLIAAIAISLQNRKVLAVRWIALNVAIASVSSGCAALVWWSCLQINTPEMAKIVVAALGFVVVYTAANVWLVHWADRTHTRNSWRDSLAKSLRPGLVNVGVYFFFGVVVATLAALDLALWAGIMFIPLAALRSALEAEHRITESYYDTITALSLMLQRAHPYTLGHVRRVSSIAEEVARRLGLGARRAMLVREAAVLHDIGKIAVDEDILDKPSRLTDEEFQHVKLHAEFGARILSPIDTLRPMVTWIRHHHERPDGTGYPDQLSDAEIPVESKIIAVVDAYDAMTGGEGNEKRSYQEPKTSAEALAELERCSGQFDAKVVKAFKHVILGSRAS